MQVISVYRKISVRIFLGLLGAACVLPCAAYQEGSHGEMSAKASFVLFPELADLVTGLGFYSVSEANGLPVSPGASLLARSGGGPLEGIRLGAINEDNASEVINGEDVGKRPIHHFYNPQESCDQDKQRDTQELALN